MIYKNLLDAYLWEKYIVRSEANKIAKEEKYAKWSGRKLKYQTHFSRYLLK